MHAKAKPPVFVPVHFRAEIERMSKAALMDLVWDFALTCTPSLGEQIEDDAIMETLRERAELVLAHRSVAS